MDWATVPDTPGVYAIFDDDKFLYAGMAGRGGKGSLRNRLKNHRNGNMVNMLKQYLWFAIVQHLDDKKADSPGEAAHRCKTYMIKRLSFRCRTCADGAEARAIENDLKRGESAWGLPKLNPG